MSEREQKRCGNCAFYVEALEAGINFGLCGREPPPGRKPTQRGWICQYWQPLSWREIEELEAPEVSCQHDWEWLIGGAGSHQPYRCRKCGACGTMTSYLTEGKL